MATSGNTILRRDPLIGVGAILQVATMSFSYRRLSKEDAAVLFVNHQCGLTALVQDYSPGEFKNSVLALADIARYFRLPAVLTTSFEEGLNGPIVPELKAMFPDSPFTAAWSDQCMG